MVRARDSGVPAATAPVRLVQEDYRDGPEQIGFLIYEPVYRTGTAPLGTDERRAQLLGFVYSPFRTGDLLAQIVAPREGEATVGLRVVDATDGDRRLLYASPDAGDRPGPSIEHTIPVAGRQWVLQFNTASNSSGLT